MHKCLVACETGSPTNPQFLYFTQVGGHPKRILTMP